MKNIKLSVIVPVYNVENYVEKCISSICNQTYKNLEIILVNDGSTDKSGIICDQFAAKDSRIKVVHKKNGGLVSARKAGCLEATGEYIINVDGDDWIDENRFYNLVHKGLKNNPDMVYLHGIYRDYPGYSSAPSDDIVNWAHEYCINDFILKWHENLYSYLIRTSLWQWCIKKYIYANAQLSVDNKICMGEDIICVLKSIYSSKKISLLFEPSYHYVVRNNSITRSSVATTNNYINIFCDSIKNLAMNYIDDQICSSINSFFACYILFMTNYRRVTNCKFNYLFPYPRVKRNSRIILYGAGTFGTVIFKALRDSKFYHVLSWVDLKVRFNKFCQCKINQVESIYNSDFDFVVVAIISAQQQQQQIKDNLIQKGVSENKIALIDYSLLTFENLKFIMEC